MHAAILRVQKDTDGSCVSLSGKLHHDKARVVQRYSARTENANQQRDGCSTADFYCVSNFIGNFIGK